MLYLFVSEVFKQALGLNWLERWTLRLCEVAWGVDMLRVVCHCVAVFFGAVVCSVEVWAIWGCLGGGYCIGAWASACLSGPVSLVPLPTTNRAQLHGGTVGRGPPGPESEFCGGGPATLQSTQATG